MQPSLFPEFEEEYKKRLEERRKKYKVIAVMGHYRISCNLEIHWVNDYWKEVKIKTKDECED